MFLRNLITSQYIHPLYQRAVYSRMPLLHSTRLMASPTAPAGTPPAAARRFTAASDRCARSASPSGAIEPTWCHLWYAAYGGSTSCPSHGRRRFPLVAPPLRRAPVSPAVNRAAPSARTGVRPRRASAGWGAAVPPFARLDALADAGGFRRRADAVGGDHYRWMPPADFPVDAASLRCDGGGGGVARRGVGPRRGRGVPRLGGGVRPRYGGGVGDRRRGGDRDWRGDAGDRRGDADRRSDADQRGDAG